VELVINGDFVDFLAHEHDVPERWLPFAYEEGKALAAFRAIVTGPDKPVFEALAAFVKKHRLTIMLGNHDLELCLPEVREELLRTLGDAPLNHLRFWYDGEALVVGDAIIEHGNAHDPANAVDFEGLRYLRAARTRGYFAPALQRRAFRPPAGSQVVTNIMNPLKDRYAFIDLLKPESEALFSLLLAIEPAARGELKKLAAVALHVGKNSVPKLGMPAVLANVNSSAQPGGEGADPLDMFLAMAQPAEASVQTLAASGPAGVQLANVGFGSWLDSQIGLLRSFTARGEAGLEERIPALRQAFRALEGDHTWRPDVEAGKRYWKAAKELAGGDGNRIGYRFVVFGHTHHAKRVDMPDQAAVYLNSGTWANLLQFPKLPANDTEAKAVLLRFANDLKANRFARDDEKESGAESEARLRQIFKPTYVRLDVRDEGKYLDDAVLETYDYEAEKVE
jgi:UDP-2,3-diacylglucosamine pyrophosphatase LpxH